MAVTWFVVPLARPQAASQGHQASSTVSNGHSDWRKQRRNVLEGYQIACRWDGIAGKLPSFPNLGRKLRVPWLGPRDHP